MEDLPPPMEANPSASEARVEQAPVAALSSAPATPVSASGAAYNFGYSIRRAEATGVKHVFDDGYETYLQFFAPPAADAQAYDAQGNPLLAARQGDYMVVPGVHRSVLVQSGWLYSHITAGPQDLRATAELPHRAALPVAAPAQSDEARPSSADAPIGTAPEETMPAATSAKRVLARLEVEQHQAKPLGAEPTQHFSVHFPKGSVRLKLSKPRRDALVQAAMQAKRIILNGEAGGAGRVPMTLARARALSAKRMLVGEGIDASKIVLTYSAASGAGTSNAKQSTRALDQRVDFVFVGPSEEPMQVAHSDGT